MPRSRNIKPGFFTNDELVELSFETRLLFIGLWTIADRDGRLVDRPKKIKIDLFPADNVDVDKMLGELDASGFIVRYTAGGQGVIQVQNFSKHQNPHREEKASVLPAPDEHDASTVQASGEHSSCTEPIGLIPDSLNLIPDSLNLIPENPRPRGEQYSAQFEEFWKEYPKGHGSKKAAYGHWKRINPDGDLIDGIMDGLEAWKRSDRWRKNFDAERWVRDRDWENPPVSEAGVAKKDAFS